MNKTLFQIGKISILLLFFTSELFGEGIKVYTIKEDLIVGTPGKLSSIFIQIENNESQAVMLVPQITLPDNWNPIFENQEINIPAHQKINKLISVYIPKDAESRQYTMEYKLVSSNPNAPSTAIEIPIEVIENLAISVRGIHAPEYVIAGEDIYGSFLVQNNGNSPQTVSLQAYNCELLGDYQIELSPKESQLVEVMSPTNQNTHKVSRKSFRLEAAIYQDSLIRKHAYLFAKIIPNSDMELNDIRRLPGHIKMSYIGRKQQNKDYLTGWQGELFTRGRLDKAGDHLIALKLRGPNQFNVSSLGQFDEYYASYTGPNLQVDLGDQNFSLSTLTELARYGRGLHVQTQKNKMEVGGFIHQPRFFPELTGEIGLFAKHHFNPKNRIGLNFIRKSFQAELGESLIWSASGVFQPFKKTKIEAEIAQGTSPTGLGYGGFISFETNPIKKLRITGLFLYADDKFRGYYNNTINYSTNINYSLNKRLSVFANIYQDERNFAQDTLFATAPSSKQWQAGFNYRLSKKTNFKGYFRQRELEDQLTTKKFHRLNRFFRLQLSQKWKNFQINGSGEYGTTENFLHPDKDRVSNFLRSYFDVNYNLNKKHRFRGFIQFFDNQRAGSNTQRQLIYGFSGNSQITKSTQIRVQYQNNFDLEDYYRDRNQMEAHISQNLGKAHQLSVISRYALQRQTVNQGDFSIVAQYQYNFGIPLEKSMNRSDVIGQISNNSKESLEGIILNLNGQKAITDAAGNFKFKSLGIGKYFLFIDKATLDVNQIPNIPNPIPIEVFPEADAYISFSITNSATISGSVEMLSTKIFSSSEEKNKGLPGPLLVEIISDNEVIRQITEPDGAFNFTGIRPGNWTLNVIHNEQFNQYIFEEKSFSIELKSGEEKDITIKIRKKERKIKFLQSLSLSNNEED